MFTKRAEWSRWAGSRSDIGRVIDLSMASVSQWAGVEATCALTIEYKQGLTESSDDPAAIEAVDRHELREIEELTLIVRPDRDAERARALELAEEGLPYDSVFAGVEVNLRLSRTWMAARLTVEGPDRSRVEGLAGQLSEILDRSGWRARWYRPEPIRWLLPGLVILAFIVIGDRVIHGLDIAPQNDKYEWQEVVGIILAVALGLSVGLAIAWTIPNLEILPEGQASRARRVRKWVVGSLSALAIGLLGAFLYDQMAG